MKPWEISDEVAAKLTELVDKYGGNKIIFSIKEVAEESGYDAKTIKKMCDDGTIDADPRRPREHYRIRIIPLAEFLVNHPKVEAQ